MKRLFRFGGLATAVAIVSLLGAPAAAGAAYLPPELEPFYHYSGPTPLSQIPPGTVLRERTVTVHVKGLPSPVEAVQLLYRTTTELGEPTVNVTTVLEPLTHKLGLSLTPAVISYQSFYDTLNPEDEPSYQIARGSINEEELVIVSPWLLAGDPVVITDIEGQRAAFAAGPEYGYNTIDGLRAALSAKLTGLQGTRPRIALVGYSGGAFGTEWAVELAPTYAPELNGMIVGAAFGGTPVDPEHIVRYVEGTPTWAGVILEGAIGLLRTFHQEAEITRYASPYGLELYNRFQRSSIGEIDEDLPYLTWSMIFKPQYPTLEKTPIAVKDANQLIMGTRGTPTVPLFIGQGTGGEQQGTPGNRPGIGPGDGVMPAGDTRTLAREYCSRGVTVEYKEYAGLDHEQTFIRWHPEAVAWILSRLAGLPAPQDCSSIPPGNDIEPLPVPREGGEQAGDPSGPQGADAPHAAFPAAPAKAREAAQRRRRRAALSRRHRSHQFQSHRRLAKRGRHRRGKGRG